MKGSYTLTFINHIIPYIRSCMFQGAVLGEIGGTRGGWSWEDSPELHPPGWLGSGEDQCLIALWSNERKGRRKKNTSSNIIILG